ncbi:MAG: sel1 repeat family protein, partial [Alphaproteobacteria bacterium]|nr:sel1 repeat family protein [Alphaproteobacteria bacterium]
MLGSHGGALADDLDDAQAAYYQGDYATALKLIRPFAEQGYAVAQNNLGLMYESGRGVPQDYAEAVKWYRLAAEQGFAQAQKFLGFMYDNGQGVPQDYAEAVKWYRLA